jgi:hypothetical protein
MRRRFWAISAIVLICSIVLGYHEASDALAAQKNGTLVNLVQPGQVLDTITYQGITVDAIYTNEAHSGADPTYSCAAFVKKFYRQIYGIGVYNLLSTNSTPLIYENKGSFLVTDQPRVGDIVRDNNRTHWAIVKSVSEDTITLIQQNYRTGTMAWSGCTIERTDPGYTFFTYSERVEEAPTVKLPQVTSTKKTLYTGSEGYMITLEQLAENAIIYYSSSQPEVATVSNEGVVSPIQPGETIIYIHVLQDNTIYPLQIDILVKEPYIKLSASKKELTVGESLRVKMKQYGLNEAAIAWKVSDKAIATINKKTGELKAKKKGTVTVTATTSNGLSAKLKLKIV